MFCANIFRKKFIFSFIFSLYIQINTLNLHIFANNLIYCLFLRIIAEFILIILYTLLYIEKKHRRRSHLWEVSSIHRRHLAPLGGSIHPPPPPRTSGRDHPSTAATSHPWEGSCLHRPPLRAVLGGGATLLLPPRGARWRR